MTFTHWTLHFCVKLFQSTPVGTTIYSDIKATDIDAGVNGAVEFFVVEGTANNFTDNDNVKIADGYGTFAIAYRHQGHVSVRFLLKNWIFSYNFVSHRLGHGCKIIRLWTCSTILSHRNSIGKFFLLIFYLVTSKLWCLLLYFCR